MSQRTVTVVGMSCERCVSAIRAEVGRIDGVRDVDVDLDSGAVTVTSDNPVQDATLRDAVEEAGYELAS